MDICWDASSEHGICNVTSLWDSARDLWIKRLLIASYDIYVPTTSQACAFWIRVVFYLINYDASRSHRGNVISACWVIFIFVVSSFVE